MGVRRTTVKSGVSSRVKRRRLVGPVGSSVPAEAPGVRRAVTQTLNHTQILHHEEILEANVRAALTGMNYIFVAFSVEARSRCRRI